MGYESNDWEIIMAKKVMTIAANISYSKAHVKIDEDN